MALKNKLNKLKNILKRMQSVVVAYSGGVDSSLLLKIAKDTLKENVLAVIARSETYPEREIKQAQNFAKKLKVKYLIIKTAELRNKNFAQNSLKRCFYCKNELFSKLNKIAKQNHLKFVIDGANLDDSKDFRPGSLAARRLKVRSPLKEAGFTKNDIRKLSKELGLRTWDKPSLACLASRIPYNMRISPLVLKRIDKAEKFLKSIGVKQVRLRHHDGVARIEVEGKDIPRLIARRLEIVGRLRKLGYKYITLDLLGYRTGSLNEVMLVNQKHR